MQELLRLFAEGIANPPVFPKDDPFADPNLPITTNVFSAAFSNEVQRMMNDPFYTQGSPYVDFATSDFGQAVDMYFDHIFYVAGWVKHRGMFSLEATDVGPDHVSVYRRGDSFIMVHICGPWDGVLGEPPTVRRWNCRYRMSFIGLEPQQLLGDHYKNSAHPLGRRTRSQRSGTRSRTRGRDET